MYIHIIQCTSFICHAHVCAVVDTELHIRLSRACVRTLLERSHLYISCLEVERVSLKSLWWLGWGNSHSTPYHTNHIPNHTRPCHATARLLHPSKPLNDLIVNVFGPIGYQKWFVDSRLGPEIMSRMIQVMCEGQKQWNSWFRTSTARIRTCILCPRLVFEILGLYFRDLDLCLVSWTCNLGHALVCVRQVLYVSEEPCVSEVALVCLKQVLCVSGKYCKSGVL